MNHLFPTPLPLAGVALDVDGTMTDTESVWDHVQEATIKARGAISTPALIASFRGLALDETARRIHRMLPRRHKPPQQAVLDELVNRFKWKITQDRVPIQPGVPELLAQLQLRAVPVAAVSNSPRHLVELTLRRTRLDEFVDLLVCADDDPQMGPKPEPDLYTFAARGLGIDPRLSWGVEDTQTGLLALQAAQFLPVAVHPDAVPPTGPVVATRSLSGLDINWLFATAAARALPHF